MKVIHVPRRFTRNAWGGTEHALVNIASSQAHSGIDSRVYTTKALDSNPIDCIEGVAVSRYNYVYPFLGLSQQQKTCLDQVGGNLFSWQLLSALLRDKDVSLLHAHTGKRLGGIVRTAAKAKNIPYVVTLHGGIFDVPVTESQRHLAHIDGQFEWGKALGAMLGSRKVLDDAAAIICVGKKEASLVKKQYPSNRVEYLPNGVDTNWFKNADKRLFRKHFAIPTERKVILSVGRIDPQKNQRVLIEALPQIIRANPAAHLVLLGPVTDRNYLKKLHLLIQQMSLEGHVTVVPGLKSSDPLFKSAYHSADVFCLASKHEPFGMVILEAWASKLPVISSSVGGIPGFVTHGSDALLLAHNDASRWSEEIVKLLNETNKARKLGINGYQKALREYDWNIVNRHLLKIYGEVVR
jgi:glycosyltransferase involved in cell wall biosynthesis